MMLGGGQFEAKHQGLVLRVSAYDLLGMSEQRMDIDGTGKEQLKFSMRDPGKVEQIVD